MLEKMFSGAGDIVHGGIESGLIGFGRRAEATHLADKLQGGGGHLRRGGGRFRPAKNFDAAAHGDLAIMLSA